MRTSIDIAPVAARGLLGATFASILLLGGCGGKDDAPPTKPAKPPVAEVEVDEEPAEEVEEVSDVEMGAAHGMIRFGGTPEEAAVLVMSGDPWCVEHHPEGVVRSDALIVNGDALVNAFVWIDHDFDGMEFDVPEDDVIIDQVNCLYVPRISGAHLDQTVMAKTSDDTLHNIHTKPKANREANFAMPKGSKPKELRFKKEEVMIEVVCDVHPWMKGWIGIVAHPFFAVTGEDGSWAFDGVPAGTYTVKVWHEVAGTSSFELTVEADGDVAADAVTLG